MLLIQTLSDATAVVTINAMRKWQLCIFLSTIEHTLLLSMLRTDERPEIWHPF